MSLVIGDGVFSESISVMAQRAVRRCAIGALQPGSGDVLVVALVIQKSDPRKVTMKRDGTERWVTGFTLRDSPSDMINLTVWSSGEEAGRLREEFRVGGVVELVRPKVMRRELGAGREAQYSPQVTSPFQLGFQEGSTVLCPHLGDSPLTQLLCVPSKASSTFLSIADIVTNTGALRGHWVDILAAVRKVGAVRKFPARDGGLERGVREVRLFDQTSDSLVLKLWDSEPIRMAEDWIPRENILFLADVRIDRDDYRSSWILTAGARTVITVNPDTQEAAALVRYAQLADFSSLSRLDQFVASLQPQAFTRTVNVATVQGMKARSVGAGEAATLAVSLYGFISRLDLDSEDSVGLRCGRCSGAMSRGPGEPVCQSTDCTDYNISGPGLMIPSQQYDLRADISDETGSLTGLRISAAFLSSNFGSAAEFCRLSGQTKTAYKWQWCLRPLKLSLALLLPTGDGQGFTGMLVAGTDVTLEEVTAKMPSPSL